jgi:hypothetical protein
MEESEKFGVEVLIKKHFHKLHGFLCGSLTFLKVGEKQRRT